MIHLLRSPLQITTSTFAFFQHRRLIAAREKAVTAYNKMSDNRPLNYKVWIVKDRLLMPDPEETTTRYHTSIFIETRPSTTTKNAHNDPTRDTQSKDQSTDETHGWIHEVTGDISSSAGMTYIRRPAEHTLESSETFHAKHFLGYVLASEYPENVERVCRAVRPPHCQKLFNLETMRNEGFKEDGSFYAPGERRERGYFKCTVWTEERVIPMLVVAEGVLLEIVEEGTM